MKKRLVTALVVVSALTLGACQQDPIMEEVEQGMELDQMVDPPDDEDIDEDIPREGMEDNN